MYHPAPNPIYTIILTTPPHVNFSSKLHSLTTTNQFSSQNKMSSQIPSDWNSLSSDLTELILSYLPISSLARASAVCKQWRFAVASPSFCSRSKNPWFFLYGRNNIFFKNNQAFAFDPDANEWIRLPTSLFPLQDCFIGSEGFFFATASSTFSYSRALNNSWHETAPLRYARCNPLISAYTEMGSIKFIVVGGVRVIGGLVDIEDNLAVELYDIRTNSWELCPPLPPDFRSGNSSQCLTSALFKGKCYVFGIYTCFVSSFDLKTRNWSNVQTLRPPGILFSFLLACKNKLVLAGLCNSPHGASFNLWRIDDLSMEFSEIAVMPQEILYGLFDNDGDDKFASLKCVGLGNFVYVFNEEHHKIYPACVCEIGEMECSWRKVPKLPTPVNWFHKVISFCSTVSLESILGAE